MNLITNNPYRTIGILVGATAAEQRRQFTRLQRFLDADQEPEDDYSFPALGKVHRTLDIVNQASSKLDLDNDKMSAALFWFYIGNTITDEPAFDDIKEGNMDQVLSIWTKLTSTGEVTQRNASAFSNLGTLYLSGILKGTNTSDAMIEKGITLKLKFLESDFIKDIKALAADEKTYKKSKNELQLLFLNLLQSEIEKSGSVSLNKFIDIITKQEFSAKEDFLKAFVEKPIEQIEKKIEETRAKLKANKANAAKIGEDFHHEMTKTLVQLKSILGASNLKYASIADKVANEILQCGIFYFNYHQENDSDNDYFQEAYKMAKSAELIAIGKLTRDRIIDAIKTLGEMKDNEISKAIQALQTIKDAYEENSSKITKEASAYAMTLGYNQTVNWTKINEMIEKSINWSKALELVQRAIPIKNVEKIKNVKDQAKQNTYKSLVDFLMSKLNYRQTIKARYLCYWETETTASKILFAMKSIPTWAKWLVAIALFLLIVGAIWGQDGVEAVFSIAFVLAIFAGLIWLKSQ